MNTNMLASAAKLSDTALLARLEALAGRAREATAELIAHLSELQTRKAHRGEGPGSLFEYCTQVLRLSEAAAFNRIAAASAARKFPMILDLLADGSINLTTVRKLPTSAPVRAPQPVALPAADGPAPASAGPTASVCTVGQPSPPMHRPVVQPLSPERYRVQFTIGKETQEKVRRLQDLMRREVPDADLAMIFDQAFTLLLREVEKKKFSATTRPRPPKAARPGSRDIPAHVERAVWTRDGGQCAFVGRKGRCTQRTYLRRCPMKWTSSLQPVLGQVRAWRSNEAEA